LLDVLREAGQPASGRDGNNRACGIEYPDLAFAAGNGTLRRFRTSISGGRFHGVGEQSNREWGYQGRLSCTRVWAPAKASKD